MYPSRVALCLFIILIIGTVLQLIGLFSIGWEIEEFNVKNSHITIYKGPWFYKICAELGPCETRSYHEYVMDTDNDSYFASLAYIHVVGTQVIAVTSFLFCFVATVLSCLIYRNHAYKFRFCMLNACLLLVSGSLMWTEIGLTLAAIVARMSVSNIDYGMVRYIDYTEKFPYSLFLSALGSSATLIVGLVNLVALWIDNFGRRYMHIQNTKHEVLMLM